MSTYIRHLATNGNGLFQTLSDLTGVPVEQVMKLDGKQIIGPKDRVFKQKFYYCHLCNHKATQRGNLRRHLADMHDINVKLYSCPHCDYTTKHDHSLQDHLVVKHGIGLIWQYCPHCDYKGKLRKYLLCHLKRMHGIDTRNAYVKANS